jgi:hypothetical protein
MVERRLPPETDQDRERWADRAAELVAKHLVETVVTRAEIQAIAKTAADTAAKEAVQALAERLGLADAKGAEAFLLERSWTRWRMEIGQQVLRQGIGAVILALMSALGVAVMFWLRSGLPK